LKEFGPATGSVAPGRGIELLDEIGFVDYVGAQSDIDPRDRNELKTAQYDFRRYFQGYLENACRKAVESNRVLQLNTGWKPVTIFPQTREVWVDADDQQFRSFCLVPIHSIADQGFADSDKGPISISPVYDLDVAAEQFADSSKLQRMESLIWKVALWTSAGRIPEGVDLFRPVYLRHWPNFPRLLVFPYALRIASLLSEHPRSLMNLSRALNIRQQYVFAFYSAARSIGLAGQAVRQVDNLFAPPDINVARGGGVLGKVLSIFKR
jgi:hypothetical protein